MSQAISIDEVEGVQYILNDSDFVLDPSSINAEGLSDIIYSDGTRAILVNEHGEIIQGETQTLVLQDAEDLSQYYIKEGTGQILVTDDPDISMSNSLDGTQIVQYVDEGETKEEPQVIYVDEEGFTIQDALSEYQIVQPEVNQNIKAIKFEAVVDLDDLIRQQSEGGATLIEGLEDENRYQYAILKDGKFHIQSSAHDIFAMATASPQSSVENTARPKQQAVDLSKITGKNLLTGQTVTLHSYIDKLHRKLKDPILPLVKNNRSDYSRKRKSQESDGLKSLLNKKLTLGKTTNGKRLVGKVIHIEKKATPNETINLDQNVIDISDDSNQQATNKEFQNTEKNAKEIIDDNNTAGIENTIAESVEDSPEVNVADEPAVSDSAPEKRPDYPPDKRKIVIHEKIVNKECFSHISRTLSGLMTMDSLRKKLQYKDIIVKVIERDYIPSTNNYKKNVSYSSGYMQAEYQLGEDGETLEHWSFVPDANTKEAIFGKLTDVNGDDATRGGQKYMEAANITLLITHGKSNESVTRVILNPTSNKCSICAKDFRSSMQLRVHMINVHKPVDSLRICAICEETFESIKALQEHRKVHTGDGNFHQCVEAGCGKFFLTAGRLKRHLAVHNKSSKTLKCFVCPQRCLSETSLKKHLITHKPHSCETCNKSFSNRGDLSYHKRVHDPCKYFACEICKRTFSRHSNLQRHVEIHNGAGELYQCAICGCTYHYMSSLTRHVVDNHVKSQDVEIKEVIENTESEEQ